MPETPTKTPNTPLTAEKGFDQTFNTNQQPENPAVRTENPAENIVTKEQKEAVEKNREEIKKALEDSLELLKKFLKENANKLTDLEKAKIKWAINSSESAKKESLDKGEDQYLVEVVNDDGSPALHPKTGEPLKRPEGVPVDGLLDAIAVVEKHNPSKEQQEQDNKHKAKQAGDTADFIDSKIILLGDSAKDQEESQAALEKYFEDKSELKAKLDEIVGSWLEEDKKPEGMFHNELNDSKDGYKYKKYLEQLKVAAGLLKQEFENTKPEDNPESNFNKSEVDKIKQLLKDSSKSYFSHHFKKEAQDLTKEDGDEQNPYTEREALFLAKDPELRAILVDKYAKQIKGFNEMQPHEQNYQLAMLALRDRKVLELPKVPEVNFVKEPRLETIPRGEKDIEKILLINVDEIAKSMAWRKAEQKLHVFYEQSSFLRRMARSFREDAKRIEFYQEALKEIRDNNSLMDAIKGRLEGQPGQAGRNPELKDYFQLLDDILEQYENNLTEATETGETVNQTQESAAAIAKMVAAHASGNINDWRALGAEYAAAGMTDRQRVELYVKNVIVPLIDPNKKWDNQPANKPKGRFASFFSRNKKESTPSQDNSLLYTSNFWRLAEQYKNQQLEFRKNYLYGADGKLGAEGALTKEDQEKLDKAIAEHMRGLGKIDIQLGQKERDLYNNKPKGILKWYEKAADWKERQSGVKGVLARALLNPFSVGVGTAVMSRGAQTIAKYGGIAGAGFLGLAFTPLTPLIVGGVAGGIYRAFRANKDLKYDIAKERRNETLGGDRSELLNKRDGKVRYDTLEYNQVIAQLESLKSTPYDQLPEENKKALASIIAVRDFEKQPGNQVDLFYDGSDQAARTGSVIGLRNKLDIELNKWRNQVDAQAITSAIDQLKQNIQQTDKEESSFRHRSALWSGTKAAAFGIAAGAAVQEGIYTAARHLGIMDSGRGTALEYLADKVTGDPNHSWNWLVGRANDLTVEGDPSTYVPTATGVSASAEAGFAGRATTPSGLENLQREDWHGVGKNFHGKELQQWHVWDKSRSNVSIDVHNMMNNLERNIDRNNTINWDKTRDSKMWEIMQEMRSHKNAGNLHEQMRVRVFPTGENYDNNQGMEIGHIDKDGKLVLDAGQRNFMFGPDGKQLVKAIEVGYMDDSGDFHTLNTAVGSGNVVELPSEVVISDPLPEIQNLKPAHYDFFVPLVPPGRTIYEREKKSTQPSEEKAIQNGKDRTKTKITPREFTETNKLASYFTKESSDKLGDKWQKAVENLSQFDLEKAKIRAEKLRLDFANTTKIKNQEGFAKQILEFLNSIDEKVFENIKNIYLVKPGSKTNAEKGDLFLVETGTKKEWQDYIKGFERINNKYKKSKNKKYADVRLDEEDDEESEDFDPNAGEKEDDEETEVTKLRPGWAKNKQAWKKLFVNDGKNNTDGLIVALDKPGLIDKLLDKFNDISNRKNFDELDETVIKGIFTDLVKDRSKADQQKQKLYDKVIENIIKLPGIETENSKVMKKYYEEVRRNLNKADINKNQNKGKKGQRNRRNNPFNNNSV